MVNIFNENDAFVKKIICDVIYKCKNKEIETYIGGNAATNISFVKELIDAGLTGVSVIPNYEIIERRLVPSLTFEYVFLRTGSVMLYSGIGSYAILENLNLDQETDIDLNIATHEYNGLIPFMRAGIKVQRGNFTVNPFLGYEFETIYFNQFSDISTENLKESLRNAGLRTGLRFGILF